ncbi:MAG: hypothetical protein IPM54_22330 [Polyangiaceae bacterium]|nr:hypothetical protein [Polyangiaceae bacterium]
MPLDDAEDAEDADVPLEVLAGTVPVSSRPQATKKAPPARRTPNAEKKDIESSCFMRSSYGIARKIATQRNLHVLPEHQQPCALQEPLPKMPGWLVPLQVAAHWFLPQVSTAPSQALFSAPHVMLHGPSPLHMIMVFMQLRSLVQVIEHR